MALGKTDDRKAALGLPVSKAGGIREGCSETVGTTDNGALVTEEIGVREKVGNEVSKTVGSLVTGIVGVPDDLSVGFDVDVGAADDDDNDDDGLIVTSIDGFDIGSMLGALMVCEMVVVGITDDLSVGFDVDVDIGSMLGALVVLKVDLEDGEFDALALGVTVGDLVGFDEGFSLGKE